LALALCCAAAQAGHGLINSFADIEWLPPPGTTPDSVAWSLDRADEALRLRLASTDAARLALLREHARERLAEVDAMVRAGEPAAAARAGEAYASILDAMTDLLGDADSQRRQAEDLLAHQYMLSTNYLDLPRDARRAILPVIESAAVRYARLARELPQRTRDALFFKEEEVRWSRDMAVAADEQGL